MGPFNPVSPPAPKRLELIHHPGSGQPSGGARRQPLAQIVAIAFDDDDSHTPCSHRADTDVSPDVRNHSDHSNSGDSQRRAADNLPHPTIGLFPAANAEGVNIYIESHRYQPPS